MQKLKIFLFIILTLFLGITVVHASSVTTVVEVGINHPTVSISASSSSVVYKTGTTINWLSTNATFCTASGAWSGRKVTSGHASTGAIYKTSTYSIYCTGPGGKSLTRSTTVTIKTPTGSLTSSASSCLIAVNKSTCLISFTWRTYNPIGTSAVTRNPTANFTIQNVNSGTNVPLAVAYKYPFGKLHLCKHSIKV